MAECIDDNRSALYVAGQLAPGERAAVEAHLDDCSACRAVLGELARQSQRHAGDDPPLIAHGTMVGRYRVGAVVGAGAMGVVYAAEDQQLGRKVALKLLRPRWSATGARRLVAEAQALARLSHPNVVQVHDAGDWQGRVFVALELVDGETLTSWLGKPRTLSSTLAMLRGAGAGLAAAHAAGLVHRDFKPDNVLVGRDGRVRVTDFGLARALDAAASEERGDAPPSPDARTTESGVVLGTPAYMSPEQRTGERATTASDQFSFCVVAWEALYGQLPAMQRVPSAAPRWPALPSVPARIRRAIERGLRDDPTARHASMDAVVASLGWDPGARRRGLVASVVVLALAAGVFALSPLRTRACRQGGERFAKVYGADRHARLAAAAATMQAAGGPLTEDLHAQWTALLDGLDRYRDSWAAGYEDACVATRVRGDQSSELLELRMSCLESRLASVDEFASLLEHADSTSLRRLAGVELPSLSACADRAALLAPVPPPRDAATAARVKALTAEVARAEVQSLAGDLNVAHQRLGPVIDEARKLGYPPLVAESLHNRAVIEAQQRDATAALRDYTGAKLAAIAGRDASSAARSDISAMYVLDEHLHRPAEAARLGDEAEAFIAQLGGDLPLEAELANAQAGLQQSAGKPDQARALFQHALELYRRTPPSLGNDLHAGRTENNLGIVENSVGHYTEALAHYDRALQLERPALGPHHPALLSLLHNRLTAIYSLRPNEGLADARHLLQLYEEALGPDSPQLMNTLALYGNLLLVEPNTRAQAPAPFERALAIAIAQLPAGHPKIAMAERQLAEALLHNHRFAEAEPHIHAGLAAAEQHNVPQEIEEALTIYTNVLIGLGRAREARGMAERARTISVHFSSANPRHKAWLDWCYARALDGTGERKRAIAVAKDAEAGFAAHTFPDDETLAEVRAWLAKRS